MSNPEIIPLTPEMCEDIFGDHDYMIWPEGDAETAKQICSLCGHEKDPA